MNFYGGMTLNDLKDKELIRFCYALNSLNKEDYWRFLNINYDHITDKYTINISNRRKAYKKSRYKKIFQRIKIRYLLYYISEENAYA